MEQDKTVDLDTWHWGWHLMLNYLLLVVVGLCPFEHLLDRHGTDNCFTRVYFSLPILQHEIMHWNASYSNTNQLKPVVATDLQICNLFFGDLMFFGELKYVGDLQFFWRPEIFGKPEIFGDLKFLRDLKLLRDLKFFQTFINLKFLENL